MKKKTTHKKDFFGEYDALRSAFAKVNIREAVAPIVRGKIVEDEETYNKVQQLLDCPDMEHAHKFLLDIDFDEEDPKTKQKVDDLYQLAVSQGYVKSSDSEEQEDDDTVEDEGGYEKTPTDEESRSEAASKDSIDINAPTLNTPAYVLFYSAMKDGEIRTGECYSNAVNSENAQLDAIQKLQRLGFTAIEIIASETVDPSSRGITSKISDEKTTFGAKNFGDEEVEEVKDEDEEDNEDKEDEEYLDSVTEAEEDEETEEDDDSEKSADKKDEKDDEEQEDEELSRSEKLDYFKRYLEEFKALLQKMKAETYAEMALADRAKFYDEMSKIWSGKPDPSKFMTDDNIKKIETMKIKLN